MGLFLKILVGKFVNLHKLAKNYLEEKEIKKLRENISSYFDYIERMKKLVEFWYNG